MRDRIAVAIVHYHLRPGGVTRVIERAVESLDDLKLAPFHLLATEGKVHVDQDHVWHMDTLARLIQKRRLAQGMIVLELPAVDLILNENGDVVDARPEDTSFSHTIIEMFMVEANEAAARLMYDMGVPCLRRIHPDPDEVAHVRENIFSF